MRRTDIKTGFLCNNNCIFCVQAHKKHLGNRSTDEIKKELEDAKEKCDEVVFTGGEFTIRKDCIELIRYANDLGYKEIQLQSNGRMLSYEDFCNRCIEAGANQFALALHGHDKEVHDKLTRAEGSFEQTVKAIKNIKKINCKVLMNTVVVKQNYQHLEDLAKLFVKLKVDQFQFAFVHHMGNALKNFKKITPKISEAALYMCKGMQIGIDNGISVMAEAMPFCVMKGYEKYVSELNIPETEVRDIDGYTEDFLKVKKEKGKMKFTQCKECKYDNICEGPWKEYPEKFGSDEFKPVKN